MGLFGKTQPPDPRKQVNKLLLFALPFSHFVKLLVFKMPQVREWTSKLRKESMQLDRQIRSIQREQEKVKTSLKQTAKRGVGM